MYCRPNQCAESLCNTYIGMHVYSMFVSYLNSFWLDIDRFGIMTSYHRDSCIVWRIYQQRLSYRPTDMPWYCNTKIINPRNYIKKYILTVLRAQVINLTSTHCIMKSVLNNSHSFNMFIQMLFFFPDDTDIFNILEEIGMKEYKNVFKENMVRKN